MASSDLLAVLCPSFEVAWPVWPAPATVYDSSAMQSHWAPASSDSPPHAPN